jgi:hypothetical protein
MFVSRARKKRAVVYALCHLDFSIQLKPTWILCIRAVSGARPRTLYASNHIGVAEDGKLPKCMTGAPVRDSDWSLQARVQELSRTEQAAEYATLLEAAEQENVELQQELRLAQDLSSSLAAALHEAQNALTHEQVAKSTLVEQLATLGMRTPAEGPDAKVILHLVTRCGVRMNTVALQTVELFEMRNSGDKTYIDI